MKKRISVLLCMLLFLGVLSGCGQSGEKPDVFGGSHLKQAALYPAGAEEPSAVITDPEALKQIETWVGAQLAPEEFEFPSLAVEPEDVEEYRQSHPVIILTLDSLSYTFLDGSLSTPFRTSRGYNQVMLGEQTLFLNVGGLENDFSKSSCWPTVGGLQGLYRDVLSLFPEG